jgi:hypothetical protein
MKGILLSILLVLAVLTTDSLAHMEGGMMSGGGQGRHEGMETTSTYYSPYQMMGYGMMGMMGPGMMGGYGMGSGMMGYGTCPCYGYGMMHNMMMGSGMGYGGCGMMGPGMMWGYGAERYQRFLDETVDLRRQLNSKTFEYYEALRNPETKTETVIKLQKEIQELQRKIYEKAK